MNEPRLSSSAERPFAPRGAHPPRYQSFQELGHVLPVDGGYASTQDLLRHAEFLMASTTQAKLVGSLLLGFSLVALLENPPSEGGGGAALANLCLGVAVGVTFATTTFSMLEAHYLHSLRAAGEAYLQRERHDHHHHGGGGGGYGDPDLHGSGGDSVDSMDYDGDGGLPSYGMIGGINPTIAVSPEDARLAAKFSALLAELEKLRGYGRGGQWVAMALLVFAVLLRLGGGDLGFVAAGGGLVLVAMAVAAAPVLSRLRASYAPLIREYRTGTAAAAAPGTLGGGGGPPDPTVQLDSL